MRVLLAIAIAGCADLAEPSDPIVWEPPAPSALEVITEFQRCLDYDDFFVAMMDRWAFDVVTTDGPCANCHHDFGMFSFDQFTFVDAMRAHVPNLLLLYTFHPAGEGEIVVNERRLRELTRDSDHHPQYELDDHLRIPLEHYRRLTYERIANGTCPGVPLPRI